MFPNFLIFAEPIGAISRVKSRTVRRFALSA
jgi:hypothetical protein